MRSIILNVAVSLDGFIEDENGSFDWCFTDQEYGMKEFLSRIDAVFYGRKSWELMRRMNDNSFAHLHSYVFSRSLSRVEGADVVTGDLPHLVKAIQALPGKDIWLFGGAELLQSFMEADLVDEMILSVHPIVLGGGKSLFQNLPGRKYFGITRSQSYPSGLVQLHYHFQR